MVRRTTGVASGGRESEEEDGSEGVAEGRCAFVSEARSYSPGIYLADDQVCDDEDFFLCVSVCFVVVVRPTIIGGWVTEGSGGAGGGLPRGYCPLFGVGKNLLVTQSERQPYVSIGSKKRGVVGELTRSGD